MPIRTGTVRLWTAAVALVDEYLGRIGSTARTISIGLQPIGLLLGGALVDRIGGSTTLALMGAAIALVSLAFVPVRAIRSATLQPF